MTHAAGCCSVRDIDLVSFPFLTYPSSSSIFGMKPRMIYGAETWNIVKDEKK
jgi:hypothetical protein